MGHASVLLGLVFVRETWKMALETAITLGCFYAFFCLGVSEGIDSTRTR